MTVPALMCALLLSAAPDPAPSPPCPPLVELRTHPPAPAVFCVHPWTEPPVPVALRAHPSSASEHPCASGERPTPGAGAGMGPTAAPSGRPVAAERGTVRAVSGGAAPAAEPTSGPAVIPRGSPAPDRDPSPVAEPREAERSGPSDAESAPVQVVHHVSTTPAPAPAETVARVVGNTSTVLLGLLGVTGLALRLTVGWPRFPEPYLGRRRVGGDRDAHW